MSSYPRMTILYAEDERMIADIVCEILTDRGHDVHHFPDGAAAAAAADGGFAFDLLLSDFNMPELDGISLASRLRRSRPELPVVIMTGNLTETLAERLRHVEGAEVHLIQKPASIHLMLSVIEAAAPRQVSLAA